MRDTSAHIAAICSKNPTSEKCSSPADATATPKLMSATMASCSTDTRSRPIMNAMSSIITGVPDLTIWMYATDKYLYAVLPNTNPIAKNNDNGNTLVAITHGVTLASLTPGSSIVVRDSTCVATHAYTQCQPVRKSGYAKSIVLNNILLKKIML